MTFIAMRSIFLLALILLALNACGQSKHSKLTVIFFDNQNPNSKVTVDTLLKSKQINLSKTTIDIFFSCKNFHLPYYVPTQGVFKNAAKDKEGDIKIYPRNVKCYEYDYKNKAVKMNISGSGTINNYVYKYNGKSQVVEVDDICTHFILI